MRFKAVIKEIVPPFMLKIYRSLHPPREIIDPASTPAYRAYKEAYQKLNKNVAWNEIVLRPDLKLKICPDTRNSFEHFCYITPDGVEEFDSFLALSKNKKRLLDIGALHGIFSLAFTAQDPSREALAVEPSPKASPFLLYNIQANPGLKVEHIEVALGEKNAEVSMWFDWHHLSVVIPTQNWSERDKEKQVVKVNFKTGDDLCAERSFYPDIIKIDIEGYEYRCLQGLQKTIRKARPVICLEVHTNLPDYGDSTAKLIAFFNEIDYRFYDVKGIPIADEKLLRLDTTTRTVVLPREASPG